MSRPIGAFPWTRVSSSFSAAVTMRHNPDTTTAPVAPRSARAPRPPSSGGRGVLGSGSASPRRVTQREDVMTDAAVRLSHVAIAVSDLPASIRFYTEGLGFELGPCFDAGDEVAAVSEVAPPVRMTSQYLTKDGFR